VSRAAVWVGRALAVLGLAAAAFGVLHAPRWALVAAAGGFAAATGLALAPLLRTWRAAGPATRPSDFAHLLDLLCRAYHARAGWAVGLREGDLAVVGREPLTAEARRRGAGVVQLACVDGRAHVTREADGTYVAVGDFPFGAAVLLAEPDVEPAVAGVVTDELRRFVAGMRLAQPEQRTERADLVARQLAMIAGGAQTLDGVAKAGVELAQQLADRGAAIVLQGAGAAPLLQVVAASTAADKRLVGLTVPEDAPAARAIAAGVPVVTQGREDVFGDALPDRRRQDRAGTIYPLRDGNCTVGALVITGPPLDPDGEQSEQVHRLVHELGSRLAAARAVHDAEQRATLDPVTGLRNRRELERQLSRYRALAAPPEASLIYLDLDHFKRLNDSLGHAAGDAALRHVAGLLQAAVRDSDLPARIGGEEFAVWMPHTPIGQGLEVAERIRRAIEATTWRWNGTPYPLAGSCGVAGFPESVGDFDNLRSAADAALYRAKQGGRNRVEKAPRGG
jgi:diguanylate cyclase (GGDEF)-like protein